MQIRIAGLLTIALVSCAVPAAAQNLPRVFISLNGGYQASTTEFDDTFTFTAHQEIGTSRMTHPIDAGPTLDAGVGVRLWRGLGLGVAVSRFVVDGTLSATSSVPHPFFMQQHREIAGDADGIRREETGVHLHAQYSFAVGRNIDVTLMGGPSRLEVNQELVTEVNYSEEYPYDTASFAAVNSTRRKGSNTGFNAGADVRWMFARHVGAGALVRFTRATVDVNAGESRTISLDAGGAQIGLGLRVAF